MHQPTFDPAHCRQPHLAYKSFFQKSQSYVRDCEDDYSRLQWLQLSVKGDATHLISKLSLNEENYEIALKVLKSHYWNEDRILDKLLGNIFKFSFPNPNKDFSNFTSSFVSLKVFLKEGTTERLLWSKRTVMLRCSK